MSKLRLPGRRGEPVTLWDNPVLRRRCDPVVTFDRSIKKLVEQLFDTMYAIETGVGLAANQIGRVERVFVFDCQDDVVGYVINPTIITMGEATQTGPEGCLSLPGETLETTRLLSCAVEGVDRNGDPVRYEGTELRARCFQHEVDHLNGGLYIDHSDDATREELEAQMRTRRWYGNEALPPNSELYRVSQRGDILD